MCGTQAFPDQGDEVLGPLQLGQWSATTDPAEKTSDPAENSEQSNSIATFSPNQTVQAQNRIGVSHRRTDLRPTPKHRQVDAALSTNDETEVAQCESPRQSPGGRIGPVFKKFRRRATAPDPRKAPGWEDTLAPAETERIHRILADFNTSALETYCAPDDNDYQMWRSGKLVPLFITTLLDHGRHVGPQVDLACKAVEPDVDLWEVGRRYPRWDQTIALAQLIGVRVRNLAHPEIQPHHQPNRPHRRMGPAVVILSFEPSAVDDITKNAPPLMPSDGHP